MQKQSKNWPGVQYPLNRAEPVVGSVIRSDPFLVLLGQDQNRYKKSQTFLICLPVVKFEHKPE